MKLHRTEDTYGVHIKVSFDGDVMWNAHTVTCGRLDMAPASDGFHKAPTVRVGLLSFGGGTAAQVAAYAQECAVVAGVAAALQDEMTRRYEAEHKAKADAVVEAARA